MKIRCGAVVKGGSSLEYETGRWRDERPVIQEEKCKACSQCELVCPDSAVHEAGGGYVIDLKYCKGCGLCARECPTKAIQMVAEEK